MTARNVGSLAYDAEQMQDVRRRLLQAENQRDAALAECERLRAALDMADKWEADGRPDGIMHLIARLRAAREGGAR